MNGLTDQPQMKCQHCGGNMYYEDLEADMKSLVLYEEYVCEDCEESYFLPYGELPQDVANWHSKG